jgi:hypothetical protein
VRGSVSAFRLGNGGYMFTTTYDNGDRCRMNSCKVQNAHNLAMDEAALFQFLVHVEGEGNRCHEIYCDTFSANISAEVEEVA